jgi:hypothetical protein
VRRHELFVPGAAVRATNAALRDPSGHLRQSEPSSRTGSARLGSVTNAYDDIDGVPCAADEALLTQLLCENWQFVGTLVSDYWAVAFLASLHHVAAPATRQASPRPAPRHPTR